MRLASSGEEGLELARNSSFEAAIVDVMMPGMDGIATIRELMKIDPSVKILASSGISEKGKLAKQAGEGVRYFITKPCTAETLLKALRFTVHGHA